MKILAFNTTCKELSVAVLENESVLVELNLKTKLSHSEVLCPAIRFCTEKANLKINDLNLIASSTGPGSFTGIRIGLSVLRGMSLSQSIPTVGISCCRALASSVNASNTLICSFIKANKNENYYGFFKLIENKLTRICKDNISTTGNLIEKIKEKTIFVGDVEVISCYCFDNKIESNDFIFINSNIKASNIAKEAYFKFLENKTLKNNPPKANYLKLSKAERELRK
ncbi:MAG: tRNA (adenosine(37)-N6)-threonylcarbamoyltransferase complex dimerization subunit type 1 TsaB [Candidatus Improbicoccus pseudotrichonymphae]|uniref:tRNA (Adenosine(37)-N6)-threonylcarbamoyltransferase complex dimerization subunit type 1 TsaB n=1 Tax=Candidatus Improbicoccus pseudotrichonymphae TaxID=3033792 RepID=A0AA48I7R4_9FIRM|nr:MAG: tRNA (adenosine(37)-N6)-threonylcarbamoyltransferase complex dimerization subunit type 1 TsaB [Candidatus Improbicoccus pseudotrichonymphae]